MYFNSKCSIFRTDLCQWPGWGGAAAAPWRSPHVAPQSAGLGGGRMGRCGPGPSAGVTPTRHPSPNQSHLPAPPVWETAAPRCRRRWEEPPCTSRACRCPDLEQQRRRWGSKVSGYISGASRGQGVLHDQKGAATKAESNLTLWWKGAEREKQSFWFLCWCENKCRQILHTDTQEDYNTFTATNLHRNSPWGQALVH